MRRYKQKRNGLMRWAGIMSGICLLALLWSGAAMAATVGLEDGEGRPGGTNVPVLLTLDDGADVAPTAALQVRLHYAEGARPAGDVTVLPRAEGFQADMHEVSDSEILILLYHLEGQPLPGGTDPLVAVLFNLDESVQPGSEIPVQIVETVSASGQAAALSPVVAEVPTAIQVVSDLPAYTIEAASGDGGSISPEGETSADAGSYYTFAIEAAEGYVIDDVLVDGESMGATESYTFAAVEGDHRIQAQFILNDIQTVLLDDVQDVNKTWDGDDDELCWAAAAANILEWGGWGAVADSSTAVFEYMKDAWSDATGLMEYAWEWWLDGDVFTPDASAGWAELDDDATTGGYWLDETFSELFHEDWAFDKSTGELGDGSGMMDTLSGYLDSGWGSSLAVYSDFGGHALTAWGYDYDLAGNYTGIWVTDSDDNLDGLKLLSLDLIDGLWYLDSGNTYGYENWFIGGIQALESNAPVPEPGTLALLALGGVLLTALRRRRRNRNN